MSETVSEFVTKEAATGISQEDRLLALLFEHTESTSVPDLSAKPIIDIVVKACDFEAAIQALAGVGYNHEGNPEILGCRAFVYSGREHLREPHLNLCPEDLPELKRNLTFRDYLREHSQAVEEYSRIKLEAAKLFPHHLGGYINYESPAIEKLDLKREAACVAEVETLTRQGLPQGVNNQLAGFMHIERYDVLYLENMANILGLAIKKDFSKQGLGKAFLLAAENWAQENGIRLMRLNSGINRTNAHVFYEHPGYVSENEQKRFVKKF